MMDGKVIGCSARCKQKPDCGGCAWRAEYLVRQEWIREYARSVGAGDRKFRYEHPDMVRRFLRLGPCVDCGLEGVCDMVCPAYARWWDLRREVWGQ
ncbi:MAG: hypothetical protein II290_10120 [Oscillospiraceae bacterium]|nr:hypothetical protein [Oscillospiraceae bacterium]